ncbi:MAG: CoA pyrophosphatase [Planctomycetaceae bacterium]|nr:CoA pyrophosphatase [Planctomycetaceae bacterium]
MTSMTPTLEQIRERFSVSDFQPGTLIGARRAAVAVILRECDDEPEVLLIRRAEMPGDPWSGHMAFPGGHLEPYDASARHAAERETWEEIGLDLNRDGRFLGALEPQRPLLRASGRSIVVAPFVYELSGEPLEYVLSNEVAEMHWVPVGPMLRHENLATVEWVQENTSRSLPGYDLGGRIVWGMTFRMLTRLFSVIDPEFQAVA